MPFFEEQLPYQCRPEEPREVPAPEACEGSCWHRKNLNRLSVHSETGRRACRAPLLPREGWFRKGTDPASPYLFSLIASKEGTEEAYREYQLALRYFNSQLVILKGVLGLTADLSSYTARHTWATMAYYSEVHPGIISEAMGHSSITVTETYLKPFKNKKIDEANATVLSPFRKTFLKISC